MSRDEKPRRPVELILLLLVTLGAAFPYFEQVRNANERPRLMQGIALVEAGEWAIDGDVVAGLDAGPDAARGPGDHRLYPNKPPGASLVGAGAYVIAKQVDAVAGRTLTLRDYTWWARLFGGLLPTLLLALYAARRHEDLYGKGTIFVAVSIYALGTPAVSYAHLFYGHQLAACLLFVGATLCADAYDHQNPRVGALGGLCAGAAVGVEYGAVFAGLPIGVMLLLGLRRARGWRPLVAALVAALIPVALLAAYHHTVFGSVFSTGYHHAADPGFAEKHSIGLLGLSWPSGEGFFTHVFSHDGGLLWWAPLFVFALWGLAELALTNGARRTEARLHLAIFLVILTVGTGLSFEGGWRVGPRYMVITLPGLIIGFAHAFDRMRSNAPALGVFAALGTWSVLLNGLAANLWPHLDLQNIHSPLGEVLLPLVVHGFDPYGLLWLIGSPGSAWLPVGAGVLGLWWALFRGVEHSVARVAALAIGAVAGVIAVWMLPGLVEPHEMGKRNLEYIERVYEPRPGADEAPPSQRLDARHVDITPPGG